MTDMDPAVLREDMVDGLEHEARDVLRSDRVAEAMRTVPREAFLEAGADRAYLDREEERFGTRVLAPSTAARLAEALAVEPGDSVLVVGVGVGYSAALLAEIAGARNVHAVDISRRLVLEARENLRDAGYDAVLVDCRDGAAGLPPYAPFDRILLEAAAVRPPTPLREQLTPAGRLVMPRGNTDQTLVAIAADGDEEVFGPVRFDPLLLDGEQHDGIERNRVAREERERAARAAESRTGWEQDWIDWERR